MRSHQILSCVMLFFWCGYVKYFHLIDLVTGKDVFRVLRIQKCSIEVNMTDALKCLHEYSS